MDLKLSGHNVLITGGTKGIGRAIAETLATEGCNIGLCARNEDDVTSAVAALSEKGVKVTGRALDVADGEAFAAWIQDAGEELGGVDAFVSNVSGGNAPGDEGWISQRSIRGEMMDVPRVGERGNELELEGETFVVGDPGEGFVFGAALLGSHGVFVVWKSKIKLLFARARRTLRSRRQRMIELQLRRLGLNRLEPIL